MTRLCWQSVDGFRGTLEIRSVTEGKHVALRNSFDQFEIFLIDEDYLCRDQSCAAEMVGSSSSEQLRRHPKHEDT